VSGQPPADQPAARPAAPATPSPKKAAPEPSPEQPSRGERRAFKDTRNAEGLAAGGDGGAKPPPDTQLKQRTGDVAAPGKPGEVSGAQSGAQSGATTEAKRQAQRREVVTQIVLSPLRTSSELEDRSKVRTDSKPFDLQAIAQGLKLQALTGVPVRAADAEQAVETSDAEMGDADKGGANKEADKLEAGKPAAGKLEAGKPVADKPAAESAEAQKAEIEKAEKLARGLGYRADAERFALGGAGGDKKAPAEGTAWLVDGSPQEIQAFLARLGDAARRAGLDLQNGEADADSVLALVPVQPQGGQQQIGAEGESSTAGREKAKSAPASGPSTGGPGGPSTPLPAARGAVPRVRLVIVLRGEAPPSGR
jgi:hypothetical protein